MKEMDVKTVEVLRKIRKEIMAYRVDHDQTEEYNDGFDDGVGYAIDIMDKYIAEVQHEQSSETKEIEE